MPEKKSERVYKVLHTQVGPWPQGAVFSESEFKKLHPLKDTEATRDAGLIEAGADAYHNGLLAPLLDSKAIAPADPEIDTPAPAPMGPENRTPIPKTGTTEVKAASPPVEAMKK